MAKAVALEARRSVAHEGAYEHRYGRFARLVRQTWENMRADARLYLAVAAYTLFGIALLILTGTADQAAYAIYIEKWAKNFLLTMPAVALLVDALMVVHRFDRRRGLAFKRRFSTARIARLLAGMAFLTVFVLFQGTFTSLKNALPLWEGGFWADRFLADADAWLHFGTDPWRYLYAIGAAASVRVILEFNYDIVWFVLCFTALFFVATSPRADSVRMRYLVSFMLVWIICGNVLAGLFLSAGPAFYGAVTGDAARFAQQMAFLARGEGFFSAAHYQTYLWSLYETQRSGLASGISAFPSVHVGLITMNAFFLSEYSRRWGMAAFAYVALILASSVYLAWHYAVDGYASIVVVAGIYALSRSLVPDEGGRVRSTARAASRPTTEEGSGAVTAS